MWCTYSAVWLLYGRCHVREHNSRSVPAANRTKRLLNLRRRMTAGKLTSHTPLLALTRLACPTRLDCNVPAFHNWFGRLRLYQFITDLVEDRVPYARGSTELRELGFAWGRVLQQNMLFLEGFVVCLFVCVCVCAVSYTHLTLPTSSTV